MGRRRGAWLGGIVLALALPLAACGQILGFDQDFHEIDDAAADGATPAEGSTADTGGGADSTVDGGADSAADAAGDSASDVVVSDSPPDSASDSALDSASDSAPDSAPDASTDACTPVAEVCDDGIDNDCNGLVDCADPACTSYTCLPAVPTGWEVVVFQTSSTFACPSSYPTPTNVSVVLPDNQSCTCTCTAATQACAQGTYTLNAGSGTCNTVSETPLPVTSCGALPSSAAIPTNASAQVIPPAPPASCGASSSRLSQTSGQYCAGPTKVGGGCSFGGSCTPRMGGNGSACVAKSGAQTCPSGYSRQYFVGSSIVDTRTCSSCTCAPQACAGSLHLYAAAGCASSSLRVDVSGTCASYFDSAFTATNYSITPSSGCGIATASTVSSGSATITNESTVCCTGN